jgi:hypothetical protein
MDKLHYGRVAAAGWLFVLVLAATLWASDSPDWQNLKALVLSDEPTAILAIVTAIAGLGGPPAVGLILDRLAALAFLAARRSMWNLRFNREFREILVNEVELNESISSPGAFHVFFYTYADSRLIDWMRRRTTYAYGSVISSMAVISGIGVALFAFDSFSLGVSLVSLAIVAALFVYAYIVTRGISETGQAWVSTIGRLTVKQFKDGLRASSGEQQAPKKGAHSARRT